MSTTKILNRDLEAPGGKIRKAGTRMTVLQVLPNNRLQVLFEGSAKASTRIGTISARYADDVKE